MVCGLLVGCASNGPAAKPKQKEASKSWIGTWEESCMQTMLRWKLYYKRKDREKFKSRANETKKWATNGDQFMKAINKMEENVSSNRLAFFKTF